MQRIYDTDLSDGEWAMISDLFPERARYPNLKTTFIPFRAIVDAILYRTKTGVQYRLLPKEYPPFRRVNEWHLKWERTGLWDRVLGRLRAMERQRTPRLDGSRRDAAPTVGILDSQSVKTTEEASSISGFDGGQKGQRSKAAPTGRYARAAARGRHHAGQHA